MLHGEESKPSVAKSQADQEDILIFPNAWFAIRFVSMQDQPFMGSFHSCSQSGGFPAPLRDFDPRLVGAISAFSAIRQLMAQPSVRRLLANSRAYAANHELYRQLDVSGRRHGLSPAGHGQHLSAQLQTSAISSTQPSCMLLGLAGIHSALEESHHLSWSTNWLMSLEPDYWLSVTTAWRVAGNQIRSQMNQDRITTMATDTSFRISHNFQLPSGEATLIYGERLVSFLTDGLDHRNHHLERANGNRH